MAGIPFPPYPVSPSPATWTDTEHVSAAILRSDVLNAVDLITQPPAFQGAQSGDPQPFTIANTSQIFSAGATNFLPGQTVLLQGVGVPSPFAANLPYYVVVTSATGGTSSNPGQFSLSGTAGGSPITATSNGAGNVLLTQVIPSSSTVWNALNLDTEINDEWSSFTTNNPTQSFAMFPGFYLVRSTFSPFYTAGGGTTSAGVTVTEGAGPAVTYGGQRVPSSANSGLYPKVWCAKLAQFSAYGNYGAPGNNYAQGAVFNDSGNVLVPHVTTSSYPQVTTQWCGLLANPAPSGILPPVPSNDSWPVPPVSGAPMPSQILGESFLNKNIRDAIFFLCYPPVMEAWYKAGSATITSQSSLPAVGQAVPLDTVTTTVTAADNYSAFTTGTHTWAAPRPGVYYVYGQAAISAASTSVAAAAGLTVTSANYGGTAVTVWGGAQNASPAGSVSVAVISRKLRLNKGDSVQLAAFQSDSGSNAATLVNSGAWQNRLITVWQAA